MAVKPVPRNPSCRPGVPESRTNNPLGRQESALSGDATQDRILGAILGMAIGDAFGMPVAGWSATTIADFYGRVTDFQPRTFADGVEVTPGEISDETEIALCIIESVTAAQGEIDVENIGIRMAYLANSPSKRWLSDQTLVALGGLSEAHEHQVPLVDDESVGADLLARGIPIGLMHSMGSGDEDALRADAAAVARITHGSPLAMTLVEAVARAVAIAARHETPLADLREAVAAGLPEGEVRSALDSGDAADSRSAVSVLASALGIAGSATSFQGALGESVAPGRATDARATLAGALYGGHHGSAVIPQRLIDGLEARIYVSLAVPWFYRTVAKLRGRAIELRADFGPI
jgi:ADP-ribosylglycohydrolase